MMKHLPSFFSLGLSLALFALLVFGYKDQDCWTGTSCALDSPYMMTMPLWTFPLTAFFSVMFIGFIGNGWLTRSIAVMSVALTAYLEFGAIGGWFDDYSNMNLVNFNLILIPLDFAMIVGILFGSGAGKIIFDMREDDKSAQMNLGTMKIGWLNIAILFIVALLGI